MSTQIDDSGTSSSSSNNIPQWKRELILRRKCHLTTTATTKTVNNNGTTAAARAGDCMSSASTNAVSTGGAGGERQSSTAVRPCERVRSDLVMVEERLSGASPADADSDSSEELQYGPGIVNKLKCKYLSLALRESRCKTRPSVLPLRRATSLDDLLDEDSVNREHHVHHNVHQNVMDNKSMQQRPNSRAVIRGNESLKRARSVETLLRCDRNNKPQQQINPLVDVGSRESFNDDVVIDERPVPAPRQHNNTIMTCNKPRRPAPLLADTERPPPDTVRSALRIFESGLRRGRPLKPVGDVALKVATYKHIMQTKKPVVLPKPVIVQNISENNVATVKPTNTAVMKPPAAVPPNNIKLQPPAPVVYGFNSNLGIKPPTSPTNAKSNNTKLQRTPPVSPKRTSKNVILDTGVKNTGDNTGTLSPLFIRTPSPILLSPVVVPVVPYEESLQSPTSNFPSIVNGGCTNGSPTRQVGVIRPMEQQQQDCDKQQKAVELEKNLKNARDNNEVVTPPAAVVTAPVAAAPAPPPPSLGERRESPLWGGPKRTWHQQTDNTVVFNFRNRKDVPDYIENDGLVLKTRRDRPKINDSGFILLEGLGASPNSTSDWDNEDDLLQTSCSSSDDHTSAGGNSIIDNNTSSSGGYYCSSPPLSPPAPCNVVFEGAPVIINGRSNLVNGAGGVVGGAGGGGGGGKIAQRPARAKLHIHFDDASTSTYEYPSEASLLEDAAAGDDITQPLNLTPPTILGSTSLSSYTPIKAGLTNTFELGVTRSPDTLASYFSTINSTEDPTNNKQSESDQKSPIQKIHQNGGDGEEVVDCLRPASDEQTISWSQEKLTTDLLF